MKISEWPELERPREKLLSKGAASLSNAELLAIFLRTGTHGASAVQLAMQLLNQFGSLHELMSANRQVFCEAKGLGEAKYAQLQAVLELSRRYIEEKLKRPTQFKTAADTKNYLSSQLRHENREVFAVLLLDSQHQFIRYEALFRGTIDSAAVYPRELVKLALEHHAAAVILAHNHPSGISEPSAADQDITTRIVRALALIDVRVLDHIVVGRGECTSFAQRGLM